LTGKAVGANWRPAFNRAYGLSMFWGLILSGGLALLWYLGGPTVLGFMTTSEAVRQEAMSYLWIASLCALIFMPAFVFDGILVGTTLNAVMRDGMVISLGVFLAAALILQPLFGNVGLWASLHIWFIARGLIYWWGLERKKAGLFTA